MPIAVKLTRPELKALRVLAAEYECDVTELAGVAVQEMLAAHRQPRQASAPKPKTVSARAYQPKACATCGKDFSPSGPRSKTCGRCNEPEYETVWNGTMSRNAGTH